VGAGVVSREASGLLGAERRVVVRRVPEGMLDDRPSSDSSRIFPGMAHEYAATVPGLAGSTLHIASAAIEIDAEASPAAHLLDRAAIALGRTLQGMRGRGAGDGTGPHPAQPANGPSFDERMEHADKLATFGQI